MKPYLVLLSSLALAGPVSGSVPTAQGKIVSGSAASGQLFIAPSGEPFRAEMAAPYPSILWFQAADTNSDGLLAEAEFLADAMRYFSTLDSDGNGGLDRAETDRYEATVLEPLTSRPGMQSGAPVSPATIAPARRKGERPGPPRQSGAGQYGLIHVPHPVKAADRDMNARVSSTEYRDVMRMRFATLEKLAAEVRLKRKEAVTPPVGHLRYPDLPPTGWQEQQSQQQKRRR